jgi:hypothetical protein
MFARSTACFLGAHLQPLHGFRHVAVHRDALDLGLHLGIGQQFLVGVLVPFSLTPIWCEAFSISCAICQATSLPSSS